MNKTYLVSYINLLDKIYAITINENKELNFLESYLENEIRKYKIPNLDANIINKTREEIIKVNKNIFMKLFLEYLNNNMKNNNYNNKEELLKDIDRFKEYINNDPKLKDFLYFQEITEQIKVNSNIEKMNEYFNNSFANKEEIKEEVKEYIETNNISEATLDNGTKIAVSNNKDNKSVNIIKLNKNEKLEDVIAETKVNEGYKNTHEVIESMANNTHISANAERPDEVDKNDTLATQVTYHENKYNNEDLIAVTNSTIDNNFADNVIIDKKTGNISEVNTYEDGSLYLNGTNQNNYSTTLDNINKTSNNLNIENIEVEDENNVVIEFEELESLYNNNEEELWTNKVEFIYETNREKWEEYMAYHEEKQERLNKEKAPQKTLGNDPRAAFIDISIIALITSIIGTSTLLAILINLM